MVHVPDSALNIALLALFSEMLYRFPNMAVANLSRDSVRAALMRGITAEQVTLHFQHCVGFVLFWLVLSSSDWLDLDRVDQKAT